MLDFDVKRCTRKCTQTDRELRPGEKVFSVLVFDGGEVRRIDYAAEAWQGPPEDALGWWEFTIPDPQGSKLQWAPSDIIRKYFDELAALAAEADKRYVLGLLMVRRRMMRLEATETDADGREHLVLYCPKKEEEYKVPVVTPTPERVQVIQQQLADLLFSGVAPPVAQEDDSPAESPTESPAEGDDA
ncbi:MAG: hypothetical protein AAGF97_11740 [Planctomycetota bacterium]